MIRSQRRAHRLFWLLAAPAIAVLALALFLARPGAVVTETGDPKVVGE